jgi:hypothetical protein
MLVGSLTVVFAYLLWPTALQTRDAADPERITQTQLLMGRAGPVCQARHGRAWEQVRVSPIPRKIAATTTYDEIVSSARRCNAREACAIAGGVRGCRCPVAVRASTKQAVDDAAQAATCEQVERLFCPPLRNPRCEKDACIADQVLE